MQLTAWRKFWICVVLVVIPAVAHAVNLSRFVDHLGREVIRWEFAIGATIPYVFLALLFLAHCERYQRKAAKKSLSPFPLAACFGAGAAWIAMIWHSMNLIASASPPPHLTSTMGIAVMLTPFLYLPYLVLPYVAGALAGGTWTRWRARRGNDINQNETRPMCRNGFERGEQDPTA